MGFQTKRILSIIAAWSILTVPILSYSIGPPLSACQSMVPDHGVPAQTDPPPFNITLNMTSYLPGDIVEVNVSSSLEFRGMFLQARPLCDTSDIAIGTFSFDENDPGLKLLDCNNNTESAVSHRIVLRTSGARVLWKAPSESAGNIVIQGTFVQYGPLFWTGVRSAELTDPSVPQSMCPNSATKSTISNIFFIFMSLYTFLNC